MLGHDVDILDAYTYAADGARLFSPFHIFNVDIRNEINTRIVKPEYDYIIHLAAETHVDNSITHPLKFVYTNTIGTANMLEFARKNPNLKLFLYFSTDEVFGPAANGVAYKEWDRYNSGNPYAASKAGGEELAGAWGNTYGLPVIRTHTMNAFGPTQHPEKFIPNTINRVRNGETVIIHADKTKTISGSRFYIHTADIAGAIEFVIEHGQLQDKYNIVGERETSNLEVAQKIAELLGKPLKYEMVDFHSSRPGHDLRYALDGSKLREMGWTPSLTIEEGLRELINV